MSSIHLLTAGICLMGKATPVGFEPTRGDPIGLAGRRLSRSARVSSHWPQVTDTICLIHKNWSACEEWSCNNGMQPMARKPSPTASCRAGGSAEPTSGTWHGCSLPGFSGQLQESSSLRSAAASWRRLRNRHGSRLYRSWSDRHLWDSSPHGETPWA